MRDLTSGSLYKNFLFFSLPVVVTGFLMQLFSIIDTAIAGQVLGEDAIAAIGATSALVTLIACALSGYAVGFSVYIARLFGAREYLKIKQSFYGVLPVTSLVVFFLLGTLVLCRGTVMDVLQVEHDIREDAASYFSIYCVTLMFTLVRCFCTFFLHALGNTLYPLFVSLFSSCLHIGCSLLFTTVIKGPLASVNGLALANMLSVALTCFLLFPRVVRYFKQLNVRKTCKVDLHCTGVIFRYALPTMLQQIIMYTSDFLVSPLINSLGSTQLSAYSVSNRIKVISEQTFTSSSKALSNYASQCIGAHKQDQIKRGVFAAALQGLLMLLPLLLVGTLLSPQVSGLFFTEKSGAFSYVVIYLRVYFPFLAFNVVTNLFHSFFRGIKATTYLLLITFVGSASKYLFALLLFENFQIHAIWMAIILSWIVEALLCALLYLIGVWKKYTVTEDTSIASSEPLKQ